MDADGIVHAEFCAWCRDGGELICCEKCPQAYHVECAWPPLARTPASAWLCARCEAERPPGVVKKILTWRWRALEGAGKARAAKVKDKADEHEKVGLFLPFFSFVGI